MASTSVSETELDLSTDNAELPLKENNENSYVNEWVDLTVGKVVAQGAKLREEAKRRSPKVRKTYDVINVNSKKSPYSESSDKSSRQRKRTRRIAQIQNRSCGPCGSSINTPRTSSYSCCTQRSRSRSRVRRCPLRIVELAVPSKRYCMATWRDKAETLPIIMVQRLKKYVMDESAIVKISDAVSCFQRKRKAPRSCKMKMMSKDKREVCLTTLKNTQDMMEIRKLCAIFGHKLAEKLALPMDIRLNSDWQRVSDVVSEEIANIIKGKTKFYSHDYHINKGIHEEISNKVAVWIATILEDTSYKLLEEDLRVKKNKERRSGQDENLVTAIENHLLSCHRAASELDEEEGPALEFIDDLVNNVMNVCIISPDAESHSDGRSDSEQSFSNENSTTDMYNVEPEQITDQSKQSKEETMQEIVNDLINGIIVPEFSDKSTTDEGNIKTKDSGEHVNTKPILNLESNPLTDEESQYYEDAEMNNDKSNPVQNSIVLEGTRDVINLFNPVVNNQDDMKVSEVLVVLAGEEPLDDKNKKVKFSELSMAVRRRLIEHSRENSIDNNNSKSNLIPNLSWVMSFSNKPDILIAPPNEHLLSDADESWPEDITTPMLRLSESVSRSVTSLGRIIESEEKDSNPRDEENMKQQAQIVEGLVEHRVKTIEPDHHTDNSTDQRTPVDNDAVAALDNSGDNTRRISMENIGMSNVAVNCIKVEVSDQATNTADLDVRHTGGITDHDTDAMEDGDLSDISCTEPLQVIKEIKVIDKIKSNQLTENEIASRDVKKGEIKDTKLYAAITNSKLITGEALLKDIGKGDHNDDVDSEANLMLKTVQMIIKLPYVETKTDYRVDPRTAPAWVSYSEASENSLQDFSKINESHTRNIKESEVRKWCKDLEQSFINLEQWNNWVANTCKQIIFSKQRGEVFAPNARKNEGRHWVKLKGTVNRDSVLWTKLSMRTREILEKYRFANKSARRLNEEEHEILLKRKHSKEESILRALNEIDRHSLWMHRLIVSTEYCVKCKCKTFSRN